MKKILYIGNSFSQDATAYLQRIADGELFVRNLYIGGCSLKMHVDNIVNSSEDYDYEIDAVGTRKISINEALTLEDWDMISVQQVSGQSGRVESYEPYLSYVLDFVRLKCPNAKLFFHRTWAYEKDSTHPDFVHYGSNTAEMFERILEASSEMAEKHSITVIPAGNAVELARKLPEFNPEEGGTVITRDGFHLSLTYGRYLAALVSYRAFTGKSPLDVKFMPEGCNPETVEKLKAIAESVFNS